ncbi:uncharacterized protein LOC110922201 [Helianthus annuus]|uniref:uncharacterized protein LOC110922201 n=1 Tax=Helianthus annuus TaxID=4232 RepID=UPI000B903423|nr:uncharacterized protein LOC110922201 [Helianthus annuus]
MREEPVPCFMSLRDLQSAAIVTYDQPPTWSRIRQGPQVPPPPDSDAAASMQSAIPVRYQVPVTRYDLPGCQYPLREPRPDLLTLESLYDRMETGFEDLHGYVDEQFVGVRQVMEESRLAHEQGMRRIEDGMRFIMEGLRLGVPSSFQPQPQAGPNGMEGVQPYHVQ